MSDVPQLPSELWDLIYEQRSAMCIQRCVRRHIMRHAHHPLWTVLCKRLTKILTLGDFSILQANAQVRHEWRTEPCSWIYTCERFPEWPVRITKEVADGVWRRFPATHNPDISCILRSMRIS